MSDPANNQQPPSSLVDPQTDADRVRSSFSACPARVRHELDGLPMQIRLKRLAKLQAQGSQSASASTSTTPSAGPSTPAPAAPTPTPRTQQQPTPQASKPATPAAPSPGPSLKKPAVESAPATPPPLKKKPATPAGPTPLDVPAWTHETIGQVLGVTLQVGICVTLFSGAAKYVCRERSRRRATTRSSGSSRWRMSSWRKASISSKHRLQRSDKRKQVHPSHYSSLRTWQTGSSLLGSRLIPSPCRKCHLPQPFLSVY
jgi:hypothetical protein